MQIHNPLTPYLTRTCSTLLVGLCLSSSVHAVDLLGPASQSVDHLAPAHGSGADELEIQHETSAKEVLLENARSYAKDYSVSVEEAASRLETQDTLIDLLAKLEVALGDRFAGAWIEHKPQLRGVVRLTGGKTELPSNVQGLLRQHATVPFEFITGAPVSLAKTVENLEVLLPRLQMAHGKLSGAEVDVKTGEIVLFIEEVDAPSKSLQYDANQLFKLPVRIEAVDAPVGDGHTRGGAQLSTCTSGFVVRHPSTGTRGYITAGHCGDNQTYYEYGGTNYSTTFIDEIRDADQDVQWHTTPHIELPHFYANSTTSYRPLEAQKNRSSQSVGGYVCHRGKTTGYSCGNIESKTFRPTYDNACPGVTCSAVWVRVKGPSLRCYPGDSGGPWFLWRTAYGIYKGQSSSGTSADDCNWAFYTAANYFGIDLVFD